MTISDDSCPRLNLSPAFGFGEFSIILSKILTNKKPVALTLTKRLKVNQTLTNGLTVTLTDELTHLSFYRDQSFDHPDHP